jgi:hypothetical protein
MKNLLKVIHDKLMFLSSPNDILPNPNDQCMSQMSRTTSTLTYNGIKNTTRAFLFPSNPQEMMGFELRMAERTPFTGNVVLDCTIVEDDRRGQCSQAAAATGSCCLQECLSGRSQA